MRRCEQLLAAGGDRLRRFAQRLLGQDADDGVQEVLHAACRSLPGFRGEAQLSTWFHTLALRVLCAFRRRRQRIAAHEVDDAVPDRLAAGHRPGDEPSPFELAVAAERRRLVLAAIERLSPALREVVLLRGEGMDYRGIAATTGLPLGTVKSRMAAAMTRLSGLLHHCEEDLR